MSESLSSSKVYHHTLIAWYDIRVPHHVSVVTERRGQLTIVFVTVIVIVTLMIVVAASSLP